MGVESAAEMVKKWVLSADLRSDRRAAWKNCDFVGVRGRWYVWTV